MECDSLAVSGFNQYHICILNYQSNSSPHCCNQSASPLALRLQASEHPLPCQPRALGTVFDCGLHVILCVLSLVSRLIRRYVLENSLDTASECDLSGYIGGIEFLMKFHSPLDDFVDVQIAFVSTWQFLHQ